jgi:mycothiol synthase
VIRVVRTDADLELCARVARAVEGYPVALAQMREAQERLLVHSGGGYAYLVDSSVPRSAYVMVRVLPEARGRGIGSALLAAAREAGRARGFESAWGRVDAGDERSLRFAERRGFAEVSREVELHRRLVPGEGEMPDGIVELRDEHRRAAYDVAVTAIPDMVTAGDAEARSFDDWLEELSGPAAFAALEDGRVVGYATLQRHGGDRRRLEHGFTGVLPAYRRRGIATRLGAAQVAWAAAHGYDELVTTTGETNVALRRQKAKLGYEERRGAVLVRGPA